MHLLPDGTFIRSDIWREGDYLDLWSVPHFLSGLVLGLTLFFLGFDEIAAAVIALLALVSYEMFEVIVHIQETRMNRVLDVVVGMASCLPALHFAPYIARDTVLFIFALAGIADATLSLLGWRASQKAGVLEAKLRAEWKKERVKLRERRQKLSARLRRRN